MFQALEAFNEKQGWNPGANKHVSRVGEIAVRSPLVNYTHIMIKKKEEQMHW
jgi:hypothetical protein